MFYTKKWMSIFKKNYEGKLFYKKNICYFILQITTTYRRFYTKNESPLCQKHHEGKRFIKNICYFILQITTTDRWFSTKNGWSSRKSPNLERRINIFCAFLWGDFLRVFSKFNFSKSPKELSLKLSKKIAFTLRIKPSEQVRSPKFLYRLCRGLR